MRVSTHGDLELALSWLEIDGILAAQFDGWLLEYDGWNVTVRRENVTV